MTSATNTATAPFNRTTITSATTTASSTSSPPRVSTNGNLTGNVAGGQKAASKLLRAASYSHRTPPTHSTASVATMTSEQQQQQQQQPTLSTLMTTTAANGVRETETAHDHTTTSPFPPRLSWRARLKQFSEYFTFSFDKSSSKRSGGGGGGAGGAGGGGIGGIGGCSGGSMRGSTAAATRGRSNNNNNNNYNNNNNNNGKDNKDNGAAIDPLTGKPASVCCTISNNSIMTGGTGGGPLGKAPSSHYGMDLMAAAAAAAAGRHRAYSVDVPCVRGSFRFSTSSGGGGSDSGRKYSRTECISGGGDSGDLSSGVCMPPPIRIGSIDTSDTILITAGGLYSGALPPNSNLLATNNNNNGNFEESMMLEPRLSIDLGFPASAAATAITSGGEGAKI